MLYQVTNKKQILPNIKCLLIVVFCCFLLFSHSVFVLFRCLVIVFIILFSRFRDLELLVAGQKKKYYRIKTCYPDVWYFGVSLCRHCHFVIHINSLFILCIYRQREWTDWIMTFNPFSFRQPIENLFWLYSPYPPLCNSPFE